MTSPAHKAFPQAAWPLLLALLGLAGCTAQSTNAADGDPSPAARESRLKALHAEIKTAIGVPRAGDAGACRTLAFGAKPCGGPWTYLVYSTEQTDPPRLERLVKEYNALEAEQNAALGLASDCMFVMEPQVRLADGVCTAGN